MATALGKSRPSRVSFPSWGQLWLIYNLSLVFIVLVLLPKWIMLLHRGFLASAILAAAVANGCFLFGPLVQRLPLLDSPLIKKVLFVAGMTFAILVTLGSMSIIRAFYFIPSIQDVLTSAALLIEEEDIQAVNVVGYSNPGVFGLPHNKVYIARINISDELRSEIISAAHFEESQGVTHASYERSISRLPHLSPSDAASLIPPDGSRYLVDGRFHRTVIAYKETQPGIYVRYIEDD